ERHRVGVRALRLDAEPDRPDVLDLLAGRALAQALHEDVAALVRGPELVDQARDVALARQLREEDAAVLLELGDGEAEVGEVPPRVLAAPDLDVEAGDVALQLRDAVLGGTVDVEVPDRAGDEREHDRDDRDVALAQLAEAEVAEPHR